MSEHDWLAERFEENRPHLRAVAYRMLGSASEADDAVQESWLRLSRAGTDGVENLGGWLTTIVARVSLNMLRSRTLRREEPMDPPASGQPVAPPPNGTDPEHEAVLADSVGLALLVVLDTLTPAERLAFVLHDMFAVPFEEIAPIVERSPVATRQLASRARRRVQEAGSGGGPGEISRRREVVAAFLAASREGDFDALLTMLDPDIVLRADNAAAQMGADAEAIGPRAVAGIFSGRAQALRPALIDGAPGAVWTYRGETRVVFAFTFTGGTITAIEQIADPERIARFEVTPLKAGLKTQRGQLAGSSGIALARTTLA
ncbi:MAG TPA: sigma-70 family RNA polymerase sigma factor [Streptosporangiaceae bacterium]|nr:sigma-70 family RNA polymerase sigma factor [Streptosporangiaceae bacterium]